MAGFFKYNDKEGQGVGKNELAAPAYIRFFKVFFGRIANMIGLNLIYIFACLPVFTIGAATAGMTYVLRNYSQNKHTEMFHDFKQKAKEYFKYGFIITIADLAIGSLLYFSYMFWSDSSMGFDSILRTIALVVILFIAYIVICTNFYIFPMMVSFDLPLKNLIKNSVILSTGKIWRNIAMIAFNAAIFLLFYVYASVLLPLFLAIAFTLCGLFNNFMIYPVLVKHVAEKVTEDSQQADSDSSVFKDNH